MFTRLGKFEIKQVLGQGAMGEVYLGVDPAIGREVAIKTILPAAAEGPDAKDRFAREAQAAGVLNHPNLVTVYEFGEDQGVLFIAMELVKGHDLEDLLRRRALSRREGLEVLAQVCDGLAYAHQNRIVHRDIKPANVRVGRDGDRLHAKVMDFGVARIGDSGMTATGMVMGTVSYMAPEYIRTGSPDPRSDLFAVGVMLYELLSGRKPFSGDTTPTILYKIVNEPPDPLDLAEDLGISPAIRAVLDRALDKDPERRYPNAEELARALRAAKDPTWNGLAVEGTTRVPAAGPTVLTVLPPDLPAPPPPVAVAQPAPSRPDRKPSAALIGGLAALALLVVAAGGFGLHRWKQGSVAAPQPAASAPVQAAAGPQAPSAATRPASAQRRTTPDEARPVQRAGSEPHRAIPAPVAEAPAQRAEEAEDLSSLTGPERRNYGMQLLSDGSRLLQEDPAKALDLLRRSIHANPGDPRPYAVAAAQLYQQRRYAECRQVIRQARAAGISRGQLISANAQFKAAMDTDSFNRRLEGDLD